MLEHTGIFALSLTVAAGVRFGFRRLRVTLWGRNEYAGKMFEFIHDVDTLSSLLAEQQATKAARKKYRFVELVSVKPI
ncbi:hypothetical protein D3C77_215890 [compost metagenome]